MERYPGYCCKAPDRHSIQATGRVFPGNRPGADMTVDHEATAVAGPTRRGDAHANACIQRGARPGYRRELGR